MLYALVLIVTMNGVDWIDTRLPGMSYEACEAQRIAHDHDSGYGLRMRLVCVRQEG